MSKAPVHTIRFGLIKASIWQNQTRSGERHSITLVRLYKNGDSWVESSRFGRDDLLLAAKALDACHTWIYRSTANASDLVSDSVHANSEEFHE